MKSLVTQNWGPHNFPDRWEEMTEEERNELILSGTDEAKWRLMFQDVPDWSAFRNGLMTSAAMAKIEDSNKNKAAVIMSKLIYALIKEQFSHVQAFAAQIDAVVTLTAEEKAAVNGIASAAHFPPVFGS